MACTESFIRFIEDQTASLQEVRLRKMFGEYGIYYKDKMVGYVCDDRLLLKPTERGKRYMKEVTTAQPYPGAKEYLFIQEVDNREYVCEIIKETYAELPDKKR
ncbi:MAG: TfoX/Sxy family protein [Bacteroidales bacterium]|nr:TfoX/Sxy family protein [Bacteroidales bacterium]